MSVYLDTSALAKWYLHEARSEEVERYLQDACPVCISALTKVEMASLVGRRARDGDIDAVLAARIRAIFDGDIALGHLVLLPLRAEAFLMAESIPGSFPEISLRSLDALHLGLVRSADVKVMATADRVMAQAAEALGIECRVFF